MKPTIVEGDRVFVNKLAYDLKIPYTTWHLAEWGAPQRGEIVVFRSPEEDKWLIKRVIGLPGDTIEMKNNRLLINGLKVDYDAPDTAIQNQKGPSQYTLTEDLENREHSVMFTPDHKTLRSFGPLPVPEGSYFMMGDNRDNSRDSRFFGFVERNQIVGRALSVVISLDINNLYKPRFDRFFSRLS
jgi:signal peptidase I